MLLRMAWKIDQEYQQKTFYISINAPVHMLQLTASP